MKFKQPRDTKIIEKRLELFIGNMLTQINKNSSVIKNEFTDSPLDKMKNFENLVKQKFNYERIAKFVMKIFRAVYTLNTKNFTNVYKELGIDTKTITLNKELLDATIKETTERILALSEKAILNVKSATIEATLKGDEKEKALKSINKGTAKLEFKSDSIAKQDIKRYNNILSDTRAKEAGVTKAIWNTANDERVRECHLDRDGQEYDISVGCYSECDGLYLSPGDDFNCRCYATYVLEKE